MKNTKNWLSIKYFLEARKSKSAPRSEILRHTKINPKNLSQTLHYALKIGDLKRPWGNRKDYVYALPRAEQALPPSAPGRPSQDELTDRLMDCIQAIIAENTRELIAQKDAEIHDLQNRLMKAETMPNRIQAKLFKPM